MQSNDDLKSKVQSAYKNWEDKIYLKSTGKFPERQKEFTTASFSPVKPLYTPDDANQEFYVEKQGFPGSYPSVCHSGWFR